MYKGIFISFTMLQRVTLQNEFYNMFVCAAVRGSTWSLVCCVTTRPLPN